MTLDLQTAVSLLLVMLAAVYLLRRARRFYLSMKARRGGACGGCGSCGSRSAPAMVTEVTVLK